MGLLLDTKLFIKKASFRHKTKKARPFCSLAITIILVRRLNTNYLTTLKIGAFIGVPKVLQIL